MSGFNGNSKLRGYAPIFGRTACYITLFTALSASTAFAASPGKTVQIAQNASSTAAITSSNSLSAPSIKTGFAQFAPKARTSNARLDYEVWSEALGNVVLDLGPSTRIRASRPAAKTGTRRVTGHKSPYRLEGSRVTFAYISDEYRRGLTEYREDLQSIANQIDLTRLSRNEQLAFWINLHNVAIIEQIAIEYPTSRPQNIKLDVNGSRYTLDEAPFITIRGQSMSLKDIRENIVYPNWKDPRVIYGFYRGDIGSPSMARYAYNADSLDYMLTQNAEEFVNSLRGFHESYGHRNVSFLYQDAAPYYFRNWDTDLTAHLLKYANTDVKPEVTSGKPIRVDRYDTVVGDLTAGRGLASSGLSLRGELGMSYETTQLMRELRDKEEYLRRRNLIGSPKGWVIIEDVETEDVAIEGIK